ncbi:hypothetical protein [Gulosibacter molinativorax]|uniref:Uncharacterized protein n=1 Tax=Gulosibacter molinativorax TaxID=256821 RepID=A0ABT7C849_9MICO|nr:hypothetical protein [Gulosibacter molinativorax]MDJ1371360.1 hypothetical protein [Gulosibacter molinativorax]QUY62857.1 Hypotetical protein [Gulosibacter molinativorax]
MFTFAFIANIVVLGIGGILLLVGILLLGYGIFVLVQARRAPEHESPSYSQSVGYPAENGIDEDFEDAPQWAEAIAVEPQAQAATTAADSNAGGGVGVGRGADSGRADAVGSAAGDSAAGDSNARASNARGSNASEASRPRIKHGREKALLFVGGLLALLGIIMLLNTIALFA